VTLHRSPISPTISPAHAKAFAAARACSPFLDNIQCTQLADPGLVCASCPTHVNDTTRLDALRAQFEAMPDCPLIKPPCALPNCPTTGMGACVANDGGPTGTCVDVR